MSIMQATEALAEPEPIESTLAIAERARCVSLLHERALSYEHKKLFHVSRALKAVAEEIGGPPMSR